MKKIIVAGPRDYNNKDFVFAKLDEILSTYSEEIHIIEGGAAGVDSLSKQYARTNYIPFTEYPADWDRYGRSAGPIRNAEMANDADELIAFVYKQYFSKGTHNMINTARKKGLTIHVVEIE